MKEKMCGNGEKIRFFAGNRPVNDYLGMLIIRQKIDIMLNGKGGMKT